jgi:hypothetical protein
LQIYNKPEKWNEIGQKLGHIQEGTTNLQVAGAIQTIYNIYLKQFDATYLKTSLMRRPPPPSTTSTGNPPGNGPSGAAMGQPSGNSTVSMHSLPTGVQQHPSLPQNMVEMTPSGADPKRFAQLMQYASLTPDELRARNVPEETINSIELNRALLIRQQASQVQFHEGVKTANQIAMTSQQQPQQQQQLLLQQRQNMLNNPAAIRAALQQPMMMNGQVAPATVVPPLQLPTGEQLTNRLRMALTANRFNQEDLQRATATSRRLMEEIQNQLTKCMSVPSHAWIYSLNVLTATYATEHIPDTQRNEWTAQFDQVFRYFLELESKLPMLVLLSENLAPLKKLAECVRLANIYFCLSFSLTGLYRSSW